MGKYLRDFIILFLILVRSRSELPRLVAAGETHKARMEIWLSAKTLNISVVCGQMALDWPGPYRPAVFFIISYDTGE